MNSFLKPTHIVILSSVLIGFSYAKSPADSTESKLKVLVEAKTVQVSTDVFTKLKLSGKVDCRSEVTVPLPILLYVLADPNATKTLSSAKTKATVGQTSKVNAVQKVEYLVKTNGGTLEKKTTDMCVGPTLEATPIIDKDGDIILNFNFVHYTLASPQKIDHQTSLPIGKPVTVGRTVNGQVKLNSGEVAIVGAIRKAHSEVFILVRAEILRN